MHFPESDNCLLFSQLKTVTDASHLQQQQICQPNDGIVVNTNKSGIIETAINWPSIDVQNYDIRENIDVTTNSNIQIFQRSEVI